MPMSLVVGQDRRLRLSTEFACLSSAAVLALPKHGIEVATVQVITGAYVEHVERRVVRIRLYHKPTEYLADVVTGTLYRVRDGACMGSPARRVTAVRPLEPRMAIKAA